MSKQASTTERMRWIRKRRKELADNATIAERKFKRILVRLGLPFRFQHIIPGVKKIYIVDFLVCGVVIEIDGDSHNYITTRISDGERDRFIEDLGYRVLRFTNSEVVFFPKQTERALCLTFGITPPSRDERQAITATRRAAANVLHKDLAKKWSLKREKATKMR